MTLVVGLKTKDRTYIAADMHGTKADETVITIDKIVGIDSTFIASGSGNGSGIDFIKIVGNITYEDDKLLPSRQSDINELIGKFIQFSEEMYQNAIVEASTPKGETYDTWMNISGLAGMLIAKEKELWRIESNFSKIPIVDSFSCIGCGETIATGVLTGLVKNQTRKKEIKVRTTNDLTLDSFLDLTPKQVKDVLDELFILVNEVMPMISRKYTWMDTKEWKKEIRNA